MHASPAAQSFDVAQRRAQKKVRAGSWLSAMHAPLSGQSTSAWQAFVQNCPLALVPSLRVNEICVQAPIAHEVSPPQRA